MQTDTVRLLSYGGNGEDVVLCRGFYGAPPDYFVDVGAAHPVWGSVTRNLITELGWTGLHVEPHPVQAERLRVAYPEHHVEQTAAGAENGHADYFVASGTPDETSTDPTAGLSTMSGTAASTLRSSGTQLERRRVETRPLHDMLTDAEAPVGFGLLKVDVEGFEHEVLAGARLSYWQPKCLVIEATRPNTSTLADDRWRSLIPTDLYRMVLFDGVNEFFVRRDLTDLAQKIGIPVNSIDNALSVFWYNRLDPDVRPGVKLTPWPV
jgi:FkbM family methyltransferase